VGAQLSVAGCELQISLEIRWNDYGSTVFVVALKFSVLEGLFPFWSLSFVFWMLRFRFGGPVFAVDRKKSPGRV
jgi:hypothetical protein